MKHQIRPLKALGQHFLNDPAIAPQVAAALSEQACKGVVLEIGPGTGILTAALLSAGITNLYCIEIDIRSVEYLHEHFPELKDRIVQQDFLKIDLKRFTSGTLSVIGNFPYNISSQILFKVLDNYPMVDELAGMFQKEVAVRLTSGPGNRDYGILSVLLQAKYDMEYLFTVPPSAFMPPPKVNSGVIRMIKKTHPGPGCDEAAFRRVVKTAFNQRRKTMRNSLRSLLPADHHDIPFLQQRPEELTWQQFAELTRVVFKGHF